MTSRVSLHEAPTKIWKKIETGKLIETSRDQSLNRDRVVSLAATKRTSRLLINASIFWEMGVYNNTNFVLFQNRENCQIRLILVSTGEFTSANLTHSLRICLISTSVAWLNTSATNLFPR